MEGDAKCKKLLFPENPFLPLGRMKCDVGKEVSKQSLVSRKLLDFHSFSKGLGAPPELMSTLSGAGGGVSLLSCPKSRPCSPLPWAGLCLPRAASRQMEPQRDSAEPTLASRFSSLAARARGRASAFISELCGGRALPGLELKLEIRAGLRLGPGTRAAAPSSAAALSPPAVSKGPERRQGSFLWGLGFIPRVWPRFHWRWWNGEEQSLSLLLILGQAPQGTLEPLASQGGCSEGAALAVCPTWAGGSQEQRMLHWLKDRL